MRVIARTIVVGLIVLTGGCSRVEEAYGAETASSGDVVFSRAFPVREDPPPVNGKDVHPTVTGLVAGPDGDLWLAGTFAGTLDLGAGAMLGDGREVSFVARLDPRGEVRWSTRVDDMGSRTSQGVAVSPAGDAFVINQSPTNEGSSLVTVIRPARAPGEEQDVARRIDGHRIAGLIRGIAERHAPQVLALRVEPGEEDVVLAVWSVASTAIVCPVASPKLRPQRGPPSGASRATKRLEPVTPPRGPPPKSRERPPNPVRRISSPRPIAIP